MLYIAVQHFSKLTNIHIFLMFLMLQEAIVFHLFQCSAVWNSKFANASLRRPYLFIFFHLYVYFFERAQNGLKHAETLAPSFSWPFPNVTRDTNHHLLFGIFFQISTEYKFPSSTEKWLIFAMKPPSSIPHNLVSCFGFVECGSPAVLAATAIVSSSLLFRFLWAKQLFCMADWIRARPDSWHSGGG